MNRVLVLIAGCLFVATVVLAVDGAEVYQKHCKVCHSIGGSGGPMAKMGGSLDGVGAKHDEAWFQEYIKNPKSKDPESKMPALKLSPEERDAVVKYLLTLK